MLAVGAYQILVWDESSHFNLQTEPATSSAIWMAKVLFYFVHIPTNNRDTKKHRNK